eukprot:TRINITY_DN1884_c0_g1_i1.p1 TRINITY_DN1884_c0_g1~~TRINITY_DN1884_c0_g1_i1.p1  ORF type:complete len:708 (+),score=74.96 TRINITY_DN1884_c0_g1_i1:28-2151(+)
MIWVLLVLVAVAGTQAGMTGRVLSPSPAVATSMNGVAYADVAQTFCAVSSKGETLASSDGKKWTLNGLLPGLDKLNRGDLAFKIFNTYDPLNPFVVWAEQETEFIWGSSDCKTFTKMKFNTGKAAGSFSGMAGGQGLVLAVDRAYHNGFICSSSGTQCNMQEFQVYGETQVAFDGPRNAFVVWNETHGLTVGSCEPGLVCSRIVPFALPGTEHPLLTTVDMAFLNTTIYALQMITSVGGETAKFNLYSTVSLGQWKKLGTFEFPPYTTFKWSVGVRPDTFVVAVQDGVTNHISYNVVNIKEMTQKQLSIKGKTHPQVNAAMVTRAGMFVAVGSQPLISTGTQADIIKAELTPTVEASGPTQLWPLVSLRKNTLLFGVEHTASGPGGATDAHLWVSDDTTKWTKLDTLKGMHVIKAAVLTKKDDSQVLGLLIHDFNDTKTLSPNYGDLYWANWATGSVTKATYKPSSFYSPQSLFHELSNGPNGTLVAAGFPWGPDHPNTKETVWWAYSTDGMNWNVQNIYKSLPKECVLPYIAGLTVASTDKAMLYFSEWTTACLTHDVSPLPKFKKCPACTSGFDNVVSTGSFFIGYNGDYLGLSMSQHGASWSVIPATNQETTFSRDISNPCYQLDRLHYGPMFGYAPGYMVVGGRNGVVCAVPVTGFNKSGKLETWPLLTQGNVNTDSIVPFMDKEKGMTYIMSGEAIVQYYKA